MRGIGMPPRLESREPTTPRHQVMAKQRMNSKSSNGADLGFEQKLWAAADKLRGHLDASEYKHVVLGLIFLKYISDAFEERHAELQKERQPDRGDRDEYAGAN